MNIGRNVFISLIITSVIVFICFAYLFKQKNGFVIFVNNSNYYNKTVQEMNGSKPPNNYSDVMSDFAKHDKWSLSTFLKNNESGNNYTQLGSKKKKKKICILNVDTRPLERFSTVGDFENMSFPSVAAYNNLFYAIQNGYDYQRITASPIPGYHKTWVKITHLYNTLHKYDIVVFFDADAYVRQPNITIEFLMARYNFTVNSNFLMASETKAKRAHDSKGRPTLNTGFIIARNNNLTKQILKQLAVCAETIPGCEKWRFQWSFEQRAFSEYFRDKLKVGSELIIAPCKELNGFEESGSGCLGKFITHAWTAKHTIRERLKKLMFDKLMSILEQEMWGENHTYIASTSDVRKLGIQTDTLKKTNQSFIM